MVVGVDERGCLVLLFRSINEKGYKVWDEWMERWLLRVNKRNSQLIVHCNA